MIKKIVPFYEDLPAVGVVTGERDGAAAADELVEVEEAELQGIRNVGLIVEERQIHCFSYLRLEKTFGINAKNGSSALHQSGPWVGVIMIVSLQITLLLFHGNLRFFVLILFFNL